MKQSLLTQAIQDLSPVNPALGIMESIIHNNIDQEIIEVLGPSSKCTLGDFYNTEPVSAIERFVPITMSILERLEHDLAVHDRMYKAIIDDTGLLL